MWILKTAEDADAPFLFRILPGSIKTVGRAPRADFIVDAALVSRLHCRLTAGATELEVVDLESTNGTYVNGERTRARDPERRGDRLGVGRVDLFGLHCDRRRGVALGIPESETDWCAARGRSSSARRGPTRPPCRPG